MKQVRPSIYNRNFYTKVYNDHEQFKKLDFVSIHDYYREIAELSGVNKNSTAVDFGCGNGNLSFYLSIAKKCSIIGIDYSRDAIKICQERHRQLNKRGVLASNLRFLNRNNDHLPQLSKIDCVFVCDVFEHMYDHEIAFVLDSFSKWKGNKSLKVIIHTDNNYYLKHVRPFFDLLGLLLGQTTTKQLKKRNLEEKRVHVNLTNPQKLNIIMASKGYRQLSVSYPAITREKIKKQLGPLSSVPGVVEVSHLILTRFIFLSPSFYALYEI